jgi:phosphopantothenate-cysteine ligase
MEFIVQLETDPQLLEGKSRVALERYGHQLVIGNILSTRKQVVYFIAPGVPSQEIRLLSADYKDVEGVFIPILIQAHQNWLNKFPKSS